MVTHSLHSAYSDSEFIHKDIKPPNFLVNDAPR
jgi:hypothetical protein